MSETSTPSPPGVLRDTGAIAAATAAAAPSRWGRWQHVAAALLVVAVIFGAYRSVLSYVYGYNDDYQFIYRVRLGRFDPMRNEVATMGRPLASLAFYGLFSLGDSVEKLVLVRSIALVGLAAFALALVWVLRGQGRLSLGFAVTVALLAALSPAGGVYAAWATAGFVPYALLVTLLAGCLVQGWLRRGNRSSLALALTAPGLVVVACTLWQAAAPFVMFAAFVGSWADLETNNDRGAVRRVWLALGVYVGSAALYLLLFKLAVRFGVFPMSGLQRVVLATDLHDKARLLLEVLRTTVTSWGRLQPGWREVGVGALTVCGCLAAVVDFKNGRLHLTRTARRLLLAGIALGAALSPLLLANENNAACRSLILPYTLVAFLAVDGFRRVLGRVAGPRVRCVAAAALVLAAALAADYHVRWGIVRPNHREYTVVRRLVLDQFTEPPKSVVFLVPPYTLLAEPRLHDYWEYGLLSSSFWWITRPFLSLLFQEIPPRPAADGSSPSRDRDFEIHYREAGNPGVPVIRPLALLLKSEGVWEHDTHWGTVQRFPRGWIHVPWLGYVQERYFPSLWHHVLGHLDYLGTGPDNLWFKHEKFGVFHTGETTYPHVFVKGRGQWMLSADEPEIGLRLLESSDPPRTLPEPSAP